MAGIEIPGLGRKLRLLKDYGHFKSWNDLGRSFNRAGSTLQWWGHGGDDRKPGVLPGEHFETLIDVLEACLPHGTSKAEIKDLLRAPATELEILLQAEAQISINGIIDDEARADCGELFPLPRAKSELIETDRKLPIPKPELSVKLDEPFRLEFSTDIKSGYFSGFQHAGQNWGPVSTYFDMTRNIILLPGLKPDGELAHMWESRDAVINRFIVMQTAEPSPPAFRRYVKDGLALDGTILGRIAHFYLAQPRRHRRMFLLALDIRS